MNDRISGLTCAYQTFGMSGQARSSAEWGAVGYHQAPVVSEVGKFLKVSAINLGHWSKDEKGIDVQEPGPVQAFFLRPDSDGQFKLDQTHEFRFETTDKYREFLETLFFATAQHSKPGNTTSKSFGELTLPQI